MTLDHKYNVAYWVDVLTEQEFIQTAYYYCQAKGTNPATIQWLYRLGQDYGKVGIPYQEFADQMTGREAPRRRRRRDPYRWSRVNAGLYREGTSYRKNTLHEKKEASQKQIWREVSGINRDKRKGRSWKSNRRNIARKAANGSYRQWCRKMILKENFDAFSKGNDDWKLIHDPWDWD